MKRICQHIESVYCKNGNFSINEALNSKYYRISGMIIRVSNHFSSNSICHMGIVCPSNESDKYIVYYGQGGDNTTYLYSFKELKDILEKIMFCNKIKINKVADNFKVDIMFSSLKGSYNKILIDTNRKLEEVQIMIKNLPCEKGLKAPINQIINDIKNNKL